MKDVRVRREPRPPFVRCRHAVGLPGAALLGVLVAACGSATDPGPNPPPPPPPPIDAGYDIAYSSYVGGNQADEAREPIVLPGGRLLFGLRARSTNMPVTAGAFQTSHGGGAGDTYLGIVSADGSALEAATYFGGNGFERPPYGMEIAANGDIVFTSATGSTNLPTSPTAFRRNASLDAARSADGYVCRISPDLSTMRWCTYLAGGWPRGGFAFDDAENVIVTGDVTSVAAFSTTPGAFMRIPMGFSDAFVMKLSSDGSNLLFSTYLGGNGALVGDVATAVRLFRDGDIALAGISFSTDFPTTAGAAFPTSLGQRDVFLARMAPDGSALRYSTLLGGSSEDFGEHPVAILPDESLLTSGTTISADFVGAGAAPGGPEDGFLAHLSPDGSFFRRLEYLGGSGGEQLLGPVVDAAGRWYVYGSTGSPELPQTANALQNSYGGGVSDGVLMIFDPSGALLYSTFIGGSGEDLIRGIAISDTGDIYLVGRTRSTNWPGTAGGFQPNHDTDFDGFVMKLSPRG